MFYRKESFAKWNKNKILVCVKKNQNKIDFVYIIIYYKTIIWFEITVNYLFFIEDEVIDTDLERTSELLTIINIQKSVLYGCVGTNEAGEGPKVRSNITVYVEEGKMDQKLGLI